MKKRKIRLASLLIVVSVIFIVAYFTPRTVAVDINHRIKGNYLEVAEAYSDLPSFPKYTDGRADKGIVTSIKEFTDESGRKVIDMNYEIWRGDSKNPGRRVYKYYPEKEEITISLTFYTMQVEERNTTNWVLRQNGAYTEIIIRGVRIIPWLFSIFSIHHNQYVVDVLNNIEIELNRA